MKIGLIDCDSHNYPNLALMKLSAWHKAKGDSVEWWFGFEHYDRVYMSRVFDSTYTPEPFEPMNADEIIKGGTGYGLDNVLPDEIEHIYPDYSLYPELTADTAYGFLTRGCPRGCKFCIVGKKEGLVSRKVADLSEWWSGQKHIELMDPNILACPDKFELLEQLIESKAYVNFSQGLDARLMTEKVAQTVSRVKIKEIHFAWDSIKDRDAVLHGLQVYAENATRKPNGTNGTVYVLTNFDTTLAEDLERVYILRDMGYNPYIMIFDKPNAPKRVRDLQGWVNNRPLFYSCKRFEDFVPSRSAWKRNGAGG